MTHSELKSQIIVKCMEGNHDWVCNISVDKFHKIAGTLKPQHHRNVQPWKMAPTASSTASPTASPLNAQPESTIQLEKWLKHKQVYIQQYICSTCTFAFMHTQHPIECSMHTVSASCIHDIWSYAVHILNVKIRTQIHLRAQIHLNVHIT